jgi:hypothetical protein
MPIKKYRECHSCNLKPGPHCWKNQCLAENETQRRHGVVSIENIMNTIPDPNSIPHEKEKDVIDYDAAIHFLRAFCTMRMVDREIVFGRMAGMTFKEITALYNVGTAKKLTIAAVHLRAKKMANSNRIFKELFEKSERKSKG